MGRPQAAKFLLQLGIDPYGDMKENLMYDTLEMNLMQKINAYADPLTDELGLSYSH